MENGRYTWRMVKESEKQEMRYEIFESSLLITRYLLLISSFTIHPSSFAFALLPRQDKRQGFDKTCIGEHPVHNLVFAFGI